MPPSSFPPMRPRIELQRAHDVLMAVLSAEPLRRMLPEELHKPLAMAADCLCWALHQDTGDARGCLHANDFKDLLFWLQHDLAEMGFAWGGSGQDYNIVEED